MNINLLLDGEGDNMPPADGQQGGEGQGGTDQPATDNAGGGDNAPAGQ